MLLEGVVTNVAAFGAFVDVGVHQDGLVHVSAMSQTFVKDPREVVKSGDVVRVKVLDVDIPRKRISLTLRLDDEPAAGGGGGAPDRPGRAGRPRRSARRRAVAAGRRAGRSRRPGRSRRRAAGSRRAGRSRRRGGRGREAPGRSGAAGSGQGGGQQRQGAPAPANDAMAEALRRAGLA